MNSTSYSYKTSVLALIIYLTLSANGLTYAGVPYVTGGGYIVFKIHPSSYLLCTAMILRMISAFRADTRYCIGIIKRNPVIHYVVSILICVLYEALLTGQGNLIVLLDTFLPAGFSAAIWAEARPEQRLALRRVLQLSIMANAILALIEVMTRANIIPLYLDSSSYNPPDQEFRPTALFDHPLTGGMITMIGLTLAPSRGWERWSYILVLTAALVAFGGRIAACMSVFSVLACRLTKFGQAALRHDKCAPQQFIALITVGFGGISFFLLTLAIGLGQRLAGHLYWDASAQVRLSQWCIIGQLTDTQLLFGVRREELIALLMPLWLSNGVEVIENFWLLMFVSLGALGFVVFIYGITSLLIFFWYRVDLRGKTLLIATVIAASTSNSLGRKSSLLVILIAAMASLIASDAQAEKVGYQSKSLTRKYRQ